MYNDNDFEIFYSRLFRQDNQLFVNGTEVFQYFVISSSIPANFRHYHRIPREHLQYPLDFIFKQNEMYFPHSGKDK